MTEARKRNLHQLNLDKVAAHSPSGRRFVDKIKGTEVLADRQALMMNVIANGNLLEESGLLNLFRLMDTEEFAAKDRAARMNEILRGAQFFAGQNSPEAPPAATVTSHSRAVLTFADLERELLDDNGLLAKAPTSARAALLDKVIGKYEIAEEVPEPAVSNQSPAKRTSEAAPTMDSVEDNGDSSTPLPSKKNKRVITFKR
ncbi:hypothetical protein O3W44_22480 [Pantoea sp. LMR881]|uniref:hypothetical protein n=1 Tax=Pantoea sp. LMR881 TaxID=3014336 RepID=UPI0022AF5997|nr:hypothetical protein [Pantoea sp. LMR881]MCZ4061190.1 hypothetical protein [Pantoea sp. LMR881]MCZ4061301.1 hypothetical protein [Pantoea sp. LMR881]